MAFALSYQPFVSLTYLVTLRRDTGISLDYCLLTWFFHEKTSSGHKIVLDKTETIVVVPVVRVVPFAVGNPAVGWIVVPRAAPNHAIFELIPLFNKKFTTLFRNL